MELIRSVAYPSELWALFRFKFGGGKEMVMPTLDYVSSASAQEHDEVWLHHTPVSMVPPTDFHSHERSPFDQLLCGQ